MPSETDSKDEKKEQVDTLADVTEQLNTQAEEIVSHDVSHIGREDLLEGMDSCLKDHVIPSIREKAVRALMIASIGTSLMAGCKNPQEPKKNGLVSTTPPIVESTPIIDSSFNEEGIVPYKEKSEIVYQAVDLQDIEEWKELIPEKREKVEKTIQTTSEVDVILLPVQSDYFYNSKENPTVWKFPAGLNLDIKDIYYFKGEDGKIARFSILPNIMASRSIPIIFLDNGHMEDGKYVIDSKNYEEKEQSEVLSTFSYIAGEDEVYPNKVINILTAMREIAEKQETNGKFIKGQEYSYIDLISLKDLRIFKDGFTSSRAIVKGGGVCAGATLISNVLYGLGEKENIHWDAIVKERWEHPSKYYVSPFGINDFVTDATVQIPGASGGETFDFRWIQPRDAYLKIDISMVPNGLKIEDTETSGVGGKSDVELIITLSFTDTHPGDQSQKIEEFISAYEQYRSSDHTNISPLLTKGVYEKEVSWDNPAYEVIMEYVYPEERIEYFQEEMEKEGYLLQIQELKEIVNALPKSYSGNLGDDLKATEWYEDIPDKERIAGALVILNSTKVEGQPLQCVGFVTLLSNLKYDGLNIQNVGGAYSFGIGGSPARTATELIPWELLSDRFLRVAITGYGGVGIGSEVMTLDDYQVGDLFVRGDIGRLNNGVSPIDEKRDITFKTGHIGAIIGKKVVDGKIVLLVADANRKNDGKIRIFEVTEHNFYKIFGEPGVKKFIIRAASQYES